MDKFFGDEYLELRDLFNKMSMAEAIGYQIVSHIQLLPINEIPYLTGEKEQFKRAVGFFIGINRVLRNDSSGKYKKLLESRKGMKFPELDQQRNYSHFS